MNKVFDLVADKFARDTDAAMLSGNYLRGKLFLDLAKKTISPKSYLLDYGCGPGRLSLLLSQSGFQVRGVDTSERMISEANTLDKGVSQVKFETIGELSDLGEQKIFDAIVCSSVIEYVSDPNALLSRFSRTIRSGGILIISFANHASLWRQHWSRSAEKNPMQTSQHQTWNYSEFKMLLMNNGFEPIKKPQFFESPSDAWAGSSFLRHSSLLGSIGLIAARVSH
jgi:2-polyprenyl-3-methyl-5-hydroxy-6-metoxy-1,4-benzoquinol methylase